MQNNYIKYKSMRIYKLHRSNELDHEYGRPAIFIKFFGFESLVWTGTTKINKEAKNKPLIMNLNNNKTYFYKKFKKFKLLNKDNKYTIQKEKSHQFY